MGKDNKPIGYYTGSGSPVEDQIEALEQQYVEWRKKPTSGYRLSLTKEPCTIFREQLWLLIRAYSQCLNDLQACQQQVQTVENNLPQIRKRQELRNFLLDHFPLQVNRAETDNTDLLDLSMRIMIELKTELAKAQAAA